MPHHRVLRADEGEFVAPAPFDRVAEGFRRRTAVDSTTGSVHMGFSIAELDAGATVPDHVHSYEESLYVLSGEIVVATDDGAFVLREGDYGIIGVGAAHAVTNRSGEVARWAEMFAPQPHPSGDDTFFVPRRRDFAGAIDVDPRDPRTRSFGHIAPDNMDPAKQTQDFLAQSASMRTALLVYSGISVKMMVDSDLGADLLTMFMVQYEPNGMAGAHDHPLEEAYLIVEGAVDAVFDGVEYRLERGDIAWAGVGCAHQFSNPGNAIVRWLETQAPQPPSRHSYRFARDWEYLRETLERNPKEPRA